MAKLDNTITFWSSDQLAAPYTSYRILVQYLTNMGNLALPVAPANGQVVPAEVVTLRLPSQVKIVSWTASRIGLAPVLPSPYTADKNLVLASLSVTPESPTLDAPGINHTYRVSGVYTYWVKVPILPGMTIPTANPPSDTTKNNLLSASSFAPGII